MALGEVVGSNSLNAVMMVGEYRWKNGVLVPFEHTSHENFSGSSRNIGPEGKVGQSSQLVHGGLREEVATQPKALRIQVLVNFSYGATEKELGKRKWKTGVRGVQLSTARQPHQPLAQEETLQTLFSGVSGRKRVIRKTMETLEVEGRKRRKSATLIKEGEKATIPVTGSAILPCHSS
ncbi:unnamed protein product [Prunus armeniaca]|uniref:Uncharacterized protein n=1 Tax=Prunus armeniaca TaxID=36596 RepID=A0A6J5TXT3_PRUAR|nr:unnamed protein product [Prunus armeniaca]